MIFQEFFVSQKNALTKQYSSLIQSGRSYLEIQDEAVEREIAD